MNMQLMKTTAIRVFGRSSLILRKYSPEILTGVGIIGIVSSAVMACRATLKVEYILDDLAEVKDHMEMAKEINDEYDDAAEKHDLIVVYTRTAVEFIKLYGPAVSLGIGSIGCILAAHGIMHKRNVALMAAYKAVEESFTNYRRRVVEEYGAAKDHMFRNGIYAEEVTETETDADGKKVKVKKTNELLDPNHVSQYARFFDESSPNWSKTPEYNLLFLRAQQNYANDLLKARGHIFLNEVYSMLGIPHSQAGAVVGWVISKDPTADNFVDFGIYDLTHPASREFVNGVERNILLDFNVDGVIYDLI